MSPRQSYKLTFLDRHGPAGMLRIKAMGYGAVVFAFTLVMFYVLFGEKLEFSGLPLVGLTLLCAGAMGAAATYVGLLSGSAAGGVAQYVTSGGSSTPYEEQFSEEQAMVMRRDYAGALASFEQRIALTPGEPRVRIAAADLYREHGNNPTRAAELYREVQRMPNVAPGHDVYVSNKLADLFLGPLEEPGRALVEFRRLIHRYPGRTADQARMALTHLKPDVMANEGR